MVTIALDNVGVALGRRTVVSGVDARFDAGTRAVSSTSSHSERDLRFVSGPETCQ